MTLALALLLWMGSQQHTGCYPNGSSGRYEVVCPFVVRGAPTTWFDYGKEPEPEPIDVPAIPEEQKRKECVPFRYCENAYILCSQEQLTVRNICNVKQSRVWTCADKSRILLTDESGGKHCIKFPKEQP